MPEVLRGGGELRQHEGARAEERAQLEDAAARRPEKQIVVEEAGVDRLRQEERVGLHVAIGEHHRDAARIEHAGSEIEIVDRKRGPARDIAVDDEIVRLRARPAEESVDGEPRVAGRHEREVAGADRVGNLEHIAHLAVLERDQALVLEALELHEGTRLLHPGVRRGKHRAARLVAEPVRAPAEIAGQLRLEHAALLVEEIVGLVGQFDEARDPPGVVDLGAAAKHVDRTVRTRRNIAGVENLGAGRADRADVRKAARDRA